VQKQALMACFWFVWTEHGIGDIHKNRSWSSDLSCWSHGPRPTDPLSAGYIALKKPSGSCIGFFEILAMTPTCFIKIK
jgi:hypothetical protein